MLAVAGSIPARLRLGSECAPLAPRPGVTVVSGTFAEGGLPVLRRLCGELASKLPGVYGVRAKAAAEGEREEPPTWLKLAVDANWVSPPREGLLTRLARVSQLSAWVLSASAPAGAVPRGGATAEAADAGRVVTPMEVEAGGAAQARATGEP